MDPIAQKMAEAMAAQFGGEVPTEVKTEPTVEAPKVEAPVVTEKTDPVVEQKTETPVVPVVEKQPEIKEPVVAPTKTFEEMLAERTGGKFNKWEDIEKELTPKDPFANEKVKHLNELAAKGIDVTSKEFLELQSLDFESMEQSDEILIEKLKRSPEGKGLPENVLRHKINKKYNVKDWIDKDESEFTEEDIANREEMKRDAMLDKEWLINYKKERTLEKAEDPIQKAAMAKQSEETLKAWEQFVDSNLVNKVSKVSIPISYKDETGKTVESSFDYEFSENDRLGNGSIMKQLPKDSGVFFGQFKGSNGEINHEAFYSFMLKAHNFEKAVALAYAQGGENRAIAMEKSMKNTNFKPAEEASESKVFASDEEALKDAMSKIKI